MTPIDPRRLARALTLRVEPLPDGRRLVTGGAAPHVVDVDAPAGTACDCTDHRTRHVECKHGLAVRLACLDPEIRDALRELAR